MNLYEITARAHGHVPSQQRDTERSWVPRNTFAPIRNRYFCEREVFLLSVGFHDILDPADLEPIPLTAHEETVCEWPRAALNACSRRRAS